MKIKLNKSNVKKMANAALLMGVVLSPMLLQAATDKTTLSGVDEAVVLSDAGNTAVEDTGKIFETYYLLFANILTGPMGKFLALGAFIIGLLGGFAMGKVMPAIIGFGVAIVTLLGPKVLSTVFTATV